MKTIIIPQVVSQAAQTHPDGYVKAIAAVVESIARELNGDPHLHNESMPVETKMPPVENIVADPEDLTSEKFDLVPPYFPRGEYQQCRQRLEGIRKILDGWYKASGTHPAVTIHRHQLAELLRIIDE